MFAGNVPQGDVHGAESAHHRRAAKVAPTVHILPMVLDSQRVLADQVALERFNCSGRRLQKPPSAGLAQTGDAGVSIHLNE